MKKLIIAMAMAASVAAFADVESANVVGMTTTTVKDGGLYLIGVQFNKVGDTSKKIDMNDLIKLSSELSAGECDKDFVGAPEIMVYNGGGYDTYYYISDAMDANNELLTGNRWADIDGYELTDASKLSLGEGFWLRTHAAGQVTVLGEVTDASELSATVPANALTLISNPFPSALSFANVKTEGLTAGSCDENFVDTAEILVYNGGGYDTYYYIWDAMDANNEYVNRNCWADIDGYELTGDQVAVGCGFWVRANGAGTLTFKK